MSTFDVPPLVPDSVLELAQSCARFVYTALGVELDITHETLPLLDHYLAQSRADLLARPEALPLVLQAAGAHFGQVLAVEFGGLWRTPSFDVHEWWLYFQPVFLALNPIGVAYDVLYSDERGERHDGPSSELRLARDEREIVEARLAALPEVSYGDYHTFSTRFDVVQIAVEALRAEQQLRGEEVAYEWADYEDELFSGR